MHKIKFLVLDEADRMVDMGFIRDVEKIIFACPRERQTLLFSATISKDIEYISKKHMKTPVRITAGEQVDPSKLHQVYYDVSHDMKFSLLASLLKREQSGLVMVFCNTRRNADKVSRNLNRHNIQAMAIHGGHSQNKRSNTLGAFHSREALILVCTDIAARGLDVKDVSHVYNYDLPKTGTDYVHRIGRTARAGKNGIAISFVSAGDHGELRQISREAGANIEKLPLPQFETLSTNFAPEHSHSGRPRHGGFNRQGFGGGRRFSRGGDRGGGSRRFESSGGRDDSREGFRGGHREHRGHHARSSNSRFRRR